MTLFSGAGGTIIPLGTCFSANLACIPKKSLNRLKTTLSGRRYAGLEVCKDAQDGRCHNGTTGLILYDQLNICLKAVNSQNACTHN